MALIGRPRRRAAVATDAGRDGIVPGAGGTDGLAAGGPAGRATRPGKVILCSAR